jgi:hypothetical protein
MRSAANTAMAAGHTFINDVKAARKDYETECHHYYEKFIAGHDKPTHTDVEHYKALIAEMELFAKFLHTDIHAASQGFGGPQDMTIHTQKIGLDTVTKKANA